MKTLALGILWILDGVLCVPLSAQSQESNPPSPPIPVLSATPQAIPSSSHVPEQQAVLTNADTFPGTGERSNGAPKLRFFRTEKLSMTNSFGNTFRQEDRSFFTLAAPTPVVDGALTFVGTIYQTPVDSKVTRWLQVLSLATSRRINAEFSYSAPVTRNSSFDTSISCSLHPNTGSGNADVAARVRYSIKF